MEPRDTIIVVGGGLSGQLTALAFAQSGLSVTVLDANPVAPLGAQSDGRSYALALASCRMLRHLGLWDSLSPSAQPILEIKVSDGRAGEGPSPLTLQFHHGEIEEGPMGHMVEDHHLRSALSAAIAAHENVTLLTESRVTDWSPGRVTTSQGASLEAPVIIGADGRGSAMADHAGIRRIHWSYDQTALVAAIAHEKPHQGIAHQFFMPSGPLAILPLTGNRSSIVWSERAAHARSFAALADDDFLMMLRPRFGSFLGEISLAGARYAYPLSLSLATRMAGPRLALVGDAAHGVHPIAGQGLNAGFRDIAALVDVVRAARQRGEDFGSVDVLRRYEAWRRFDNVTLALATDGFNRLFSNDIYPVRLMRDVGIGLVNRLPFFRRGFIREAAGLTGELPTLMQAA